MRKLILAGLAALIFTSSPAAAQEVERYVNAQRKPQAVDETHRLPTASGATANPDGALDSTQAHAQSNGVIFTGRGNFYSATVTLATGQGPGFLLVWDLVAVPADGALSGANLPMRCFYVDAGPRSISFGSAIPLGMNNGLVWAFSTGANCQTKTAATANFVAVSFKEE